MRTIVPLITLVALVSVSHGSAASDAPYDWAAWEHLAVQDGGRCKPMDSLAWETLRLVANRGSFDDPDTSEKLTPVAVYLSMLFDWQGWNKADEASTAGSPHAGHGSAGAPYFEKHEPDKWDQSEFIRIDFLALREALGAPADKKHFSPLELSEAVITVPESGESIPFLRWCMQLIRERDGNFTQFESKALEAADKLWSYQDHRMGRRLHLLPIQGSEDEEWLSFNQLMQANLDDNLDPTGDLRRLQQQVGKVRSGYLSGQPDEFNAASQELIGQLRAIGPQFGTYPDQEVTDLEVAYNHWAPFRFAWILTLFAFLSALLAMGTHWRFFYGTALLAHACGLVAMVVGFGMRMAISGRAPVTNMYESVIYVGLGIAALGLVLELIYRKRSILVAAAAVSTVALILADNCSILLDPTLKPLQPVLRNNFWLVTHVLTITLSYAAFGLALGIANITLGYFLVGSRNKEAISALNNFTYRSLQVGVLLLAIGTILGGVWADFAWGRFWGWDPKEVWALIALLGYLGLLHARFAGWVGQFGLAAWSVFCFSLVVVAWYGVNFVLGAGLHSYGFGGGGQEYVAAVLILQFAYVGLAGLRFRRTHSSNDAEQGGSEPTRPVLVNPATAYRNEPARV